MRRTVRVRATCSGLACVVLVALGCEWRPAGAARQAPGTGAAASVQAPVVPGLPGYPGSEMVSFETGAEPARGFSRVYRATFTSVASFEEVESFYEMMIVDGGWRLMNTSLHRRVTDGVRSLVQLTVSKGSSLAVVEIGRDDEVVTFAIERKDR